MFFYYISNNIAKNEAIKRKTNRPITIDTLICEWEGGHKNVHDNLEITC